MSDIFCVYLHCQVCREGQVLDANQASILRVFGIKMATFRLKLIAGWHAEGEEDGMPRVI